MTTQDFMLQTVQRLQALETSVSLLLKIVGALGFTVLGSIGSRLVIYFRNGRKKQ